MDDFADQTYVPVVEDHPSAQKVRVSHGIYGQTPRAIYTEQGPNMQQPQRRDIESCSLNTCDLKFPIKRKGDFR